MANFSTFVLNSIRYISVTVMLRNRDFVLGEWRFMVEREIACIPFIFLVLSITNKANYRKNSELLVKFLSS